MDITEILQEAFIGGIFIGVVSLLTIQFIWKAIREPLPNFGEEVEEKVLPSLEEAPEPQKSNVYRFEKKHGQA